IRSTSEVLQSRFGTCIDLAATYSAVCEAAGLHPVLAIVEGHALPGIMLAEQTLAGPVLLEAGAIRNVVAWAVLLPLDAVFSDEVSFADAGTRARGCARCWRSWKATPGPASCWRSKPWPAPCYWRRGRFASW